MQIKWQKIETRSKMIEIQNNLKTIINEKSHVFGIVRFGEMISVILRKINYAIVFMEKRRFKRTPRSKTGYENC